VRPCPPGFQSFEQLNQRAVAVVIDPIQSVKGKVVIDAFRTINPQLMLLNQEPRQTTSNIGHLNKPSIQALIHGLNRHYYSIVIDYRKNELEEQVRRPGKTEGGTGSMKLEMDREVPSAQFTGREGCSHEPHRNWIPCLSCLTLFIFSALL